MATIKEVARQANVSIATVSYVLNGTGSVSASTRSAVLAAVDALNYRPSYRGRALQSRRSMTVGLVLPVPARATDPSFGALLAGLSEGAAQGGYYVLLAANTAAQPEASLHGAWHRSGRVDGVVIMDVQSDDPRIAAARAVGVPFICAGRTPTAGAFVAVDGVAGMLEAMAHLIVRGHERIALLQPPLEGLLAAEQEAGYREALSEAGLVFDPALVVESGGSEAEGYAATEEWLAQPEPPSAIVAGTSALAFGALHALHDGGLRIGPDVALLSFEDTPAAAHTAPPLTALRQPMHEWGRALARGLIDVINGVAETQVIVQPQLIVRRSCGE
ncbi:MAG: LacI family transcriptional regulator [Chloroflexota bacterium]|nr:LacI family transcriptional regulator [Chloroflexota bacterium]PLS79278.1 MAG: LacI family transcriptional regulator [Chloroflexota bacterium]